MKVVGIECHVLVDPTYDPAATSSAQDDFVVEVFTDEGITGIGEADVNPWIARACVEAPGTHTMDRGLGATLLGKDPTDSGVWQELYTATAMAGRRGALIHALGALDMAVWDIRGKAAGVPVWKLLGERHRSRLDAYASLEPQVDSLDGYEKALVSWALRARELGFEAMKAEVTFSGPYANMGVRASDDAVTELLRSLRKALGPDPRLMVDLQYAFDSVARAATAIEQWQELGIAFVEAPLWIDDLDDYRSLADRSPIPIAVGEWQSTHHEFRELVERGRVHILQPDLGRVGGISEALKVCDLAMQTARTVIPHAWKSGITLAATAHLATVSPAVSCFEFLHPELCESRIRKELVEDEIHLTRGGVTIPQAPGLGVELNRAALEEFEEAAQRLYALTSTRSVQGGNDR